MHSSFARRISSRLSAQLVKTSSGVHTGSYALSRSSHKNANWNRLLSTIGTSDDPQQAMFKPTPPTSLTMEIAEGIQNANHLILKYGVGKQRLELLAKDESNLELVMKWQRMMEIYLGAQLHMIAALGYETNEEGIMRYTQHLAQLVTKCPPEKQEHFKSVGRQTWRDMLTTAFKLDPADLTEEELSIVDARNIMHRVSSKLIEPEILTMVAERCAQLKPESNVEMEMGMKHQIIQDVVVNDVYLGGSPKSLVEELGFGTGEKGYAMMQFKMAYHESDPLCAQYTASAMVKLWKAAGLDLSQNPQAARLPMSGTPV